MAPWYLKPEALAVIAKLRANPPVRRGNTSTNPLETTAGYEGPGIAELYALYAAEFARLNATVPWSREAAHDLLDHSINEVLAALFGCPDGLDWAHPDRAARRVAMAVEIDAALAGKLAA